MDRLEHTLGGNLSAWDRSRKLVLVIQRSLNTKFGSSFRTPIMCESVTVRNDSQVTQRARIHDLNFILCSWQLYTPMNRPLNSGRSWTPGLLTIPLFGCPSIHIAVLPPWSISIALSACK